MDALINTAQLSCIQKIEQHAKGDFVSGLRNVVGVSTDVAKEL